VNVVREKRVGDSHSGDSGRKGGRGPYGNIGGKVE
jgi:hypothetical protein